MTVALLWPTLFCRSHAPACAFELLGWSTADRLLPAVVHLLCLLASTNTCIVLVWWATACGARLPVVFTRSAGAQIALGILGGCSARGSQVPPDLEHNWEAG